MVHYWKVVVAECLTIIMNSVMILHGAVDLTMNFGIYLGGNRGVPCDFLVIDHVNKCDLYQPCDSLNKQPSLLVGHLESLLAKRLTKS